MPTERLQHREVKNQRSDQTSKRRDASSSSSYIRDFAVYQYIIHEQQHTGNGKDIMTPEMEMKDIQAEKKRWANNHEDAIAEVINERGGITGGEVQLGNQKEGLKGAGPRNTSDYFDDNEELHRSDWARLERKLNKVEKAFNTLQYIKKGEGDHSEAILNAAIIKRERTGERLDKYPKDVTSSRLRKYYRAFHHYRDKCNSDEEVYLNAVGEKSPVTAEIDDNADNFREGLRSTLGIIEKYKEHAPND